MSPNNCTEISIDCPVSLTTYGYYPILSANVFFAAIFACCMIGQLVLGIRHRTWSFMVAVGVGSFGEMVGYVGRIIMHKNPWSQTGFEIQICCLILSPSFLAAGIYLSLKHLTRYFGPEYSRLRPVLYTWVFVGCDLGSIVLQATGGGIASTRKANLVNVGDDIMIAGIAFQVITMGVCGALAMEYSIRLRRSSVNAVAGLKSTQEKEKEDGEDIGTMADPTKTKMYCLSLTVAFVAILVRCIYRIPEMAGGWGNPRMRNQHTFIVLDGAMIAIAAVAMTIFHPGVFFPPMGKTRAKVSVFYLNS